MISKRLLIAILLVLLTTNTALAQSSSPEVPPPPEAPFYPGEPSAKADFSLFQAPVPAGLTAQQDNYGYTWDDSLAPAWLDLTSSGTEVLFSTPNEDDESVGPFNLGFNFHFYENLYDKAYISTNGLITFGSGSDQYDNQASPRDTSPNNYITPFWDDLVLSVDSNGQKVSRVFYKTGTGTGGKYFAVEWYQLTRLGSQEKLTFQAILYESGDIVFQYNELNGKLDQATVGIEDEHGVDGLLYLHNAPGLSVSKAVRFIHPASAEWRVKVYPAYRSGFLINNQISLYFTVRNTGDKTDTDVYDLGFSGAGTGWQLNLFSGDGKTQLTDTDGDGTVDTGALAPGEDFPIILRVQASPTAVVGDHIRPLLTATSTRSPTKHASIQLQIAIPAPFAQASLDIIAGPNLRLVWMHNLYGTNLNTGQQFTGSNLSVIDLPDRRYFYSWEHNLNISGKSYANLEFLILNRFGMVDKQLTTMTDNSKAVNSTEDRFLSLASASDGRIGTIWVRTQRRDSDQKINQNIYFARLDANGKLLSSPTNLTENNLWRGQDDYDVPAFIAPRIAVTQDNRFFLAWGDERSHPLGSSADLFYAVLGSDGSMLSPATPLTASVAGETRYSTPALVALPGDRVLVGYVIQDPGDPQDPLDDQASTAYLVLNKQGGKEKNQTLIGGSSGSTPDGFLLSGGARALLGWNVPASSQVQYALVDTSTLDVSGSLVSLPTPKGRVPSTVSVTGDGQGHAILTWGEAEQSDYLCYTLVNGQGAALTPPMIYAYGLGDNPLINTNSYGLGNAVYDGSWQVQLPYMQR